MSTTVKNIPDSLIYEMVDGTPIYYQGYKEYLKGKKSIEDIMGSSVLQSAIITNYCCSSMQNLVISFFTSVMR